MREGARCQTGPQAVTNGMPAGSDALAQIEAAIGAESAGELARRFGGTTVYVPREIGEHHPLRVALGAATAEKLAAWCGGSRLNVPKRPERHARVRQLHRAGSLTIAGIALETGYSERHVYRLIQGEADRDQLELFPE